MEKKQNKGVVDEILKMAEAFKSEGDAFHDMLLVAHVQDTPKNRDRDPASKVFFEGCMCNFEALILMLCKKDKDFFHSVLRVVHQNSISLGRQQSVDNLINQALNSDPGHKD